MQNPSKLPKINVIIIIGIKLKGSTHAINIAAGINTKKEIKIPFNIAFIFTFDVAIKKPTIIHIKKAERFASHVNP